MAGTNADAVKAAVTAHWNRRAADFDTGPSHGLLNPAQDQAWRSLLHRLAPPVPMLDVLDVGCGTGFLALLLAEAGHRATGIDLAGEMLAQATDKATARGLPVRFMPADAEAPPFAAASFDLIVERHVLWTLPHPERALAAWHELLRPGGQVALVEGAWWDMQAKDEYRDVHAALPLFGGRPAEDIALLLRRIGFAQAEVVPLMDPALWTEPSRYERYMVTARRTEA